MFCKICSVKKCIKCNSYISTQSKWIYQIPNEPFQFYCYVHHLYKAKYDLYFQYICKHLPIDQKLSQLTIITGHINADPGIVQCIKEGTVGGIFFLGEVEKNKFNEFKKYTAKLHSYSLFPLLLACDEEGGSCYTFLKGNKDITPVSPEVIGKKNDLSFAFKCGSDVGKLMAEANIQISISPVVDLDAGDRHFSKDPEVVIRNVRMYIEGMHKHGVYASIKHYPGLGYYNGKSSADNITPFYELRNVADLITASCDSAKSRILHDKVNAWEYATNEMNFPGLFLTEGPSSRKDLLMSIDEGYSLVWVDDNSKIDMSKVGKELLKKINTSFLKVMKLKFPFNEFCNAPSIKQSRLYKVKSRIDKHK